MGVRRSTRWLVVACLCVGQLTHAQGGSGLPNITAVSEEFVRLGSSSLAVRSHSTFRGYALGSETISEVRFYVEAVHQPGLVVLSHPFGLSATAMVTAR